MKKILFRADGSPIKGMGDIHDTYAIAKFFKKREVVFASTKFEHGYQFLLRTGIEVIPLGCKSPVKESEEMRAIINEIKPSAVMLYSPNSYPETYYCKIREVSSEKGILSVGRYSPYISMDNYLDVVLDYGDPFDKNTTRPPFYFGPHFIPLSSALKPSKLNRLKRKKNSFNVFVSFGGGDFINVTRKILEALRNIKDNFTFHIVLGEACTKEMGKSYIFDKFEFYRGLPQLSFAKLMISCDLAIAAGGTTAFELAHLGVPSLLFAIDEHQPRNIGALSRRGAAIDMGHISEFNPDLLLECLLEIMGDRDRLEKMSQAGIKAVDGMGANRIKGLILAELHKRRSI